MDDRREPPAEPGSHPPIAFDDSPGTPLSPIQQTHIDYSRHANECQRCSDVDRGRCGQGEQLWRDWTAACDEAYRQLHRGTP